MTLFYFYSLRKLYSHQFSKLIKTFAAIIEANRSIKTYQLNLQKETIYFSVLILDIHLSLKPNLARKSQTWQQSANVSTNYLHASEVISLKLPARIMPHLFKFLLGLSSEHAPRAHQLLSLGHFQLLYFLFERAQCSLADFFHYLLFFQDSKLIELAA